MVEIIKNAQIDGTMLGLEHHGIFTCYLYLDYGDSSHQGFGGYVIGGEFGIEFLRRILEVVDVEKWEELEGKYIRVRLSGEGAGWGNKIEAIGHITKDEWFSPKELAKKYFPKEK